MLPSGNRSPKRIDTILKRELRKVCVEDPFVLRVGKAVICHHDQVVPTIARVLLVSCT
jgi:hypothetical protein